MSVLIRDEDFAGVTKAATMGILRGHTMRNWWKSSPSLEMQELPDSQPGARMQCFFGSLELDDSTTSILGCFQTSTFPRRADSSQPPVSLAQWVGDNFLRQARWRDSHGCKRGFSYRPVLVLGRGGAGGVRRVDEDLNLKLSEIGTVYDGAAVRLDLLDYMRALPHVGKLHKLLEPFNREAGYLVIHPEFLESPHPAPAGCVEQYCFGYSVAPWTVMPTIAAYGPGRFYAAFKQFRFFLMEDGAVSIEVLFLVAPRCRKVFNILGFDPVFHTVALLNALTLGRTSIDRAAHEGVDRFAMGHHARIHHNLLDGMRHIWEKTNWQPAGQLANSSAKGR